MSHFDEHLFGRIAVLNGYLTPEQLQECLAVQKSMDPARRAPIGEILRSKGYLKGKHLSQILEIRKNKLRKLLRDAKELIKTDKVFGQIALKKGMITLEQLESALLEQQRLKLKNFQIRLGEVLVALKHLKVNEVFDILAEQNGRILICPSCDCHFTVLSYSPEKRYKCSQCDAYLKTPTFLDTVVTDGVLEDQVSEE
ncbi:MAG: hypothetical protein HY717_05325 [Planctomycetes bacterium]|nr:hypothetical protein [Planctomycetota bacterium]